MAERRGLVGHPIFQLTRARLLELFREPAVVFWVFGFPIVVGVGLGLAFRDQPPERARVALVVAAGVDAPALVGDALEVQVLSADAAREALRRTRVDLVAELGPGGVTYRFDPAQPKSRFARVATEQALERARGHAPTIVSTDVVETPPGARYVDFLLPGLLGLNLMGSSMWGVGYAIVDARSRKLMKRFAATPMRRSHYLVSFILARLVLLAVEVGVLLGFGVVAFDLVVQGSLLTLAALALLGASAFAGIALLIAARATKPEVASGWMNFVQMPMYLLSGAFFSYERFPEALHPWLRLLPLTALNDALRAVVNEGAGFAELGAPCLVLVAWGLVPFFVALRAFRWQ